MGVEKAATVQALKGRVAVPVAGGPPWSRVPAEVGRGRGAPGLGQSPGRGPSACLVAKGAAQ